VSPRAVYATVGGVLAVLLVVMLATYDYSAPDEKAQQKAEALVAAYRSAGLGAPGSPDELARQLGDDGGAVCASAGPIGRGYLKTRLGVGGELYFRPVRVDRRALAGYLLVAKVYCPDKLDDIHELYDGLRFAHVIRS
jgi:hypothetical protein